MDLIDFEKPDFHYIKYLIETGECHPNTYIKKIDSTLFEYIVINKIDDHELIEYMLEKGADTKSCKNGLPLMIYAARENNTKLVKLLIKYGADVNIMNGEHTPLNVAVKNNNFKLIKVLIAHGGDPNFGDVFTYSALEMAIKKMNMRLVKLLIDHGADINKIHSISMFLDKLRYNFNFIKDLISCGLDLSIFTNEDKTIIFEYLYHIKMDIHREHGIYTKAIYEEITNTIKFFLDSGIKPRFDCVAKAIDLTIKMNNIDLLHMFKNYGVDFTKKKKDEINFRGCYNHFFSSEQIYNNIDIIKFLISVGVDVKHVYKGDNVITNLLKNMYIRDMYKNPKKAYELVKLFVEHGADINHRNHKHYTPIWVTINFRTIEGCKYLISKGADLDTTDIFGNTPLFEASQTYNGRIFQTIYEGNPKNKIYDLSIFKHFNQNPEFGASLYLEEYEKNNIIISEVCKNFYKKLYIKMLDAQKDQIKKYRLLVEKVGGIDDIAEIIMDYKDQFDKLDILAGLFSN